MTRSHETTLAYELVKDNQNRECGQMYPRWINNTVLQIQQLLDGNFSVFPKNYLSGDLRGTQTNRILSLLLVAHHNYIVRSCF